MNAMDAMDLMDVIEALDAMDVIDATNPLDAINFERGGDGPPKGAAAFEPWGLKGAKPLGGISPPNSGEPREPPCRCRRRT